MPTPPRADRSRLGPTSIRAVVAAVSGTTASILPAFLTGAIGVQLIDELDLRSAAIGIAFGGYFLAAALGSALLGRLAERLGGTAGLRLGLTGSALSMLLIGLGANSAASLTIPLVLAGVANALNQPAANLMLFERLDAGRLGLALAIKQSGMPLATLVGGVAVPSVALTIGWRWAYGLGAVGAMAAAALAPGGRGDNAPRRPAATTAAPSNAGTIDLRPNTLVLYAVAGMFAAAAAVSLASYLVIGAEAAGVSPALSGLLLAFGSAIGITSRLTHGWLADQGRLRPIRRVSALMLIGALGFAILATHRPAAYIIGPVIAFGCGWSWPGLFNLSVVRNNPSAPAAATGVAQTGVFIGSASGPVAGGFLIESVGYPTFWLTAGGSLLVAGTTAAVLSRLLARTRVPVRV